MLRRRKKAFNCDYALLQEAPGGGTRQSDCRLIAVTIASGMGGSLALLGASMFLGLVLTTAHTALEEGCPHGDVLRRQAPDLSADCALALQALALAATCLVGLRRLWSSLNEPEPLSAEDFLPEPRLARMSQEDRDVVLAYRTDWLSQAEDALREAAFFLGSETGRIRSWKLTVGPLVLRGGAFLVATERLMFLPDYCLDMQVGWLVVCLVGCLVGWSVGWLLACLVGCLLG